MGLHRIIESHLNKFSESFGLEEEQESVRFEKFVNYALISSRIASSYELDDVTTGPGDDGMDGVAVIIDEEVVISPEDADAIFAGEKRNRDADLVFIQSKTSESFDLGDYLKFKESVLRFVNQTTYQVSDETQNEAHKVFNCVVNNVPKLRGGKPSITVRYVTTGVYRGPEPFEAAQREFVGQLVELGLFKDVDVRFVGRDEITDLWVGTYNGVNAELEMYSSASLPAISGINEAYLAVVRAKDLVEKLLISSDGNLRTQVFEDNVRAFLGADNPVNQSISDTLRSTSSATRFPVLNNGITIVSPDVVVQGSRLFLNNFQIVNGCQTSNMLYENRASLDESIMVNVKIVETANDDVFLELVRATNSQTRVEETQFLSLRPFVRKVEHYFNTYEGDDSRVYFERRDRQYVGKNVPAIRIFSVHNAAKCVAAMFLNRPELSARYPKAIFDEHKDQIFHIDNKEAIFYASCLTLYRVTVNISNSTIPQDLKKVKWHLLSLIRRIIVGKEQPRLNSKESEAQAKAIIAVMSQHTDAVEVIKKAVSIIQSMGPITTDRLKRQAILTEMFDLVST